MQEENGNAALAKAGARLAKSVAALARWLVSLTLAALWVVSAQTVAAADLFMTLPGDELAGGGDLGQQAPPAKLPHQWYSVSILENGSLKIGSVTKTRPSDWIVTNYSWSTAETGDTPAASATKVEPTTHTRALDLPEALFGARATKVEPTTHTHALDLPDSALLGFRFWEEEAVTPDPLIRLGVYPAAAAPFLLTTEVRVPVVIGKESWTLSTEYVRRKDGRLLDGSVALIAVNSSGERVLLVPPAAVMAFARQEVLWVGHIATREPKGSPPPSLILRRTWVTGEIDYVVVIDKAIGKAYFDPDRATRAGESGIDAFGSVRRHIDDNRQLPDGKFGVAAFRASSDEIDTERRLAEAEVPGTILDRQFVIDAETVRFTLEYLPPYQPEPGVPTSTPDVFYAERPSLLKVRFRGKSQVLLQTNAAGDDSSVLRVQVGQSNGEIAIQVEASPHYNNDFYYGWVWSEEDGRFLRVFVMHLQGC